MISQARELRAMRLDGMHKATGWFIFCAVASSVLLWTVAFGLRVYLRYDVLQQDYEDAIETLQLSNHRATGYKYTKRHAVEIQQSKELLKMTQKKRALIEEWNESHLCGSSPCMDLLMGEQTLRSLVMYFVASAFGLSLIANGVINLFWLAARSSISSSEQSEETHQKLE